MVGCSQQPPDAQGIIDDAIDAHGAFFKGRTVEFDFREIHYTASRSDSKYTYTRSWQDDSLGFVKDVLIKSSKFTRLIDGDTVTVNEEWRAKYASSINSVLYFFQIPYVLNDRGAIKTLDGEYEIKGEKYWGVRVTFSEDGGGEDFEDVFLYWIHQENKMIDYLAYTYLTDGGGVRFREAYNRRNIDGLITQDYVNYKAEKGTELRKLPELFEAGQLEELSRIENKNVSFSSIGN